MQSLCTYLPASILSSLITTEQKKRNESTPPSDTDNSTVVTEALPTSTGYDTVALFADVSGFTAMCEVLASQGENGNELLAKHLNSYFELLVRIMSSQGGDVFKFAGDAIIVLWPPSSEDLTSKVRRAAQCAVDISENLQEARMAEGVRLSVKVGVGVGHITILNLGGVLDRLEYLAIGDPLAQAFHAEHQATKREVVVSPQAWSLVSEFFEADVKADGHAFLKSVITPIRKVNIHKSLDVKQITPPVVKAVERYMSPAILESCTRSEDKWISELRRITVLFVNLGVGESELVHLKTQKDFVYIHNIIKRVQTAVYRYEGSLNKFLMDDKGSTLIAVFGLPPCAHEDDSMRGVLAALDIYDSLAQFGLRASVGVTTGNAFCGVIGARGRREYSVLGDIVNLSARLMQHATVHGTGVIVGPVARRQAELQRSKWDSVDFYHIAEIKVKGKTQPINISKPIKKSRKPVFLGAQVLKPTFPEFLQQALDSQDTEEQQVEVLVDFLEDLTPTYEMLTNKFQQYLTSPTNATLILTCDWGFGKSHVLYTAMMHTTIHCTQAAYLLSVAGNGYTTRTQKYCIFEQMIMLVLREKLLANNNNNNNNNNNQPSSSSEREEKHAFRLQLRSDLADQVAMLPVLNDVLTLFDLEETSVTLALDAKARDEAVTEVLLQLLRVWSTDRPVILAVDDGTYVDADSWHVLHQLRIAQLPVLLIVSTRPMHLGNMVAFSTEVPPEFLTFRKNLDNIEAYTMSKWETKSILNLAVRALHTKAQVKDIYPAPIGRIVLSKCGGNPKAVLEFIRHVKQELVTLQYDEDEKQLSIQSLVPLSLTGTRVIPPYCMLLFGSKLDRITRFELYILKTAALLEGTIPGAIVKLSYPIAVLASAGEDFNAAFEHLVEMKILNLTSATTGKPDQADQMRQQAAHQRKKHKVITQNLMSGLPALSEEPELEVDLSSSDSEEEEESSDHGNEDVIPPPPPSISLPVSLKLTGDSQKKKKQARGLSMHTRTNTAPALSSRSSLKKLSVEPDLPQVSGEYVTQTYEFRFPYMIDVIKSRMLQSTVEKITANLLSHGGVIAAEEEEDDHEEDGEAANEGGHKVYAKSLFEGWLTKCGGNFATWKKRYCILFSDKMMYFINEEEATRMRAKGEIFLTSLSTCDWDDAKGFTDNMFLVTPSSSERVYKFKADIRADGEKWINTIKKLAENGGKYSTIGPATPRNNSGNGHSGNGEKANNRRSGGSSKIFSLDDFKHKDGPVLGINDYGPVFDESVIEGYMLKTGGRLGSWKRRYFIMFDTKILYFRSDTEITSSLGEITLAPDSVTKLEPSLAKATGGGWSLKPSLGSRKYKFIAKDAAEVKTWQAKVEAAVAKLVLDESKSKSKIAAHSTKEGYLRKSSGKFSRWQKRYFICFSNRLQWFHNRGDLKPAGECTLYKDSIIQHTQQTKKPQLFLQPTPVSKSYVIAGKDAEEIESWIKALSAQAALQQPYGASHH